MLLQISSLFQFRRGVSGYKAFRPTTVAVRGKQHRLCPRFYENVGAVSKAGEIPYQLKRQPKWAGGEDRASHDPTEESSPKGNLGQNPEA